MEVWLFREHAYATGAANGGNPPTQRNPKYVTKEVLCYHAYISMMPFTSIVSSWLVVFALKLLP